MGKGAGEGAAFVEVADHESPLSEVGGSVYGGEQKYGESGRVGRIVDKGRDSSTTVGAVVLRANGVLEFVSEQTSFGFHS